MKVKAISTWAAKTAVRASGYAQRGGPIANRKLGDRPSNSLPYMRAAIGVGMRACVRVPTVRVWEAAAADQAAGCGCR